MARLLNRFGIAERFIGVIKWVGSNFRAKAIREKNRSTYVSLSNPGILAERDHQMIDTTFQTRFYRQVPFSENLHHADV